MNCFDLPLTDQIQQFLAVQQELFVEQLDLAAAATADGSGPNNAGTKCPGAKYGLYVLAGIPVIQGLVAYGDNMQIDFSIQKKDTPKSIMWPKFHHKNLF